jgi:hypothetical protein
LDTFFSTDYTSYIYFFLFHSFQGYGPLKALKAIKTAGDSYFDAEAKQRKRKLIQLLEWLMNFLNALFNGAIITGILLLPMAITSQINYNGTSSATIITGMIIIVYGSYNAWDGENVLFLFS